MVDLLKNNFENLKKQGGFMSRLRDELEKEFEELPDDIDADDEETCRKYYMET